MADYRFAMFMLQLTWLAFVVAVGCCIGSLINVIVYRMPRGLGIVTPPSSCPKCHTRLTWRENIPVLGWILLRGRCRFCKEPISAEYPAVEAFVGALFGLFYILWFMVPPDAVWLGIHWGAIRPEWALNSAEYIWPSFVVLLALLGSLVAMTLVDAKTFTIPLALTWFPAIVAVIVHPVHAAWLSAAGRALRADGGLRYTAAGEVWTMATPGPHGWPWIFASIGAVLGLGIAVLFVSFGLIRRSFADYEEWEQSVLPSEPSVNQADAAEPSEPGATPTLPGPTSPDAPVADDRPADLWIQYPHARREMVKEVLFLTPCLALAMAGWRFGAWYADPTAAAPLWLTVLGGVLLGYLIGGGVVWAVRILGSLAFGKEAMGLGDVHLMAAVGACLGWIDATIAFFGAAFVGLFYTVLSAIATRGLRRAMPYGPFLAVATVLVLLCKPLIEQGLTLLVRAPTPIDLP